MGWLQPSIIMTSPIKRRHPSSSRTCSSSLPSTRRIPPSMDYYCLSGLANWHAWTPRTQQCCCSGRLLSRLETVVGLIVVLRELAASVVVTLLLLERNIELHYHRHDSVKYIEHRFYVQCLWKNLCVKDDSEESGSSSTRKKRKRKWEGGKGGP